jgi:excisionase family DNA binding protein
VLTDTSHNATQAQDWLTPKDLQRELQIGEKLAYRLLKDGTIPSIRVGGLIRIYRPHLEEALLDDPELSKKKGAPDSTPDPINPHAQEVHEHATTR